ncbi:hypothetical protein BV22DRAFT_608071 [Leucogyrophana mollusca]|uniref:Uncharacterized protein n=1 Tax=Leucogyrophana mollusca TaxID=85980 RepID=A0ACB8BD74_9AGAM|nr:hypothetical protein BV22DRAFT_608071 [Leucogyrophana mollusca]
MLYNFSVMRGYFASVGPNSFGSVEEEGEPNLSVFEPWGVVDIAVQLTLNIVLLAFALLAAIKHACEARGLQQTWSINPLVKTLVSDQIIYFIGNVIWQATIISMIVPNSIAGSMFMAELLSFFTTFAVLAGPRMVISLRAQELKKVEGSSHGELSTVRFGDRDLPARSVEEREPEPEPMMGCGRSSTRRQAGEEGCSQPGGLDSR